jgi:hypothetical protein
MSADSAGFSVSGVHPGSFAMCVNSKVLREEYFASVSKQRGDFPAGMTLLGGANRPQK